MDGRRLNLTEIHIAALLFGLTGLFGKFLALPAPVIVFGRTVFAAMALDVFFSVKKVSVKLESRRDVLSLFAVGVLLAVHWTVFYQSVQTSTVAVAVLTFSAYPVFVTFIEPAMFGERLRAADVVSAAAIVFGVLLIVPAFDMGNNVTVGILWGMLSSFAYAVMSLFNRRFASKYQGTVIAFYEQLSAGCILIPSLFVFRPSLTCRDWALLALLGVVFTGFAHSLFIQGMKMVRAQTAGVIASLESVYGIAAAALLLGEMPSARELFGGAVILGVAFLSTVRSTKE